MARRYEAIPFFVVLLLVLTQVLAQILGIVHTLDSDAHEPGHPCELCTHLGTLDHGISTPLPLVTPSGVVEVRPPAIPHPIFLHQHTTYFSRAPPARHT